MRTHPMFFRALSVSSIVVLLLTGCGGPSGNGGGNGNVGNQAAKRTFTLPLPLFDAKSPWNQKANTAAVLAQSAQQILVTYRVLRGDTTTLYPSGPAAATWPFMDINYDHFSVPVFRAGSGQQTAVLCNYEGQLDWTNPKVLPNSWQDAGGPVTIPAPAGAVRPAGPVGTNSDGHLVLYNPDTHIEYDFWQATTVWDGKCKSRGGGLTGSSILEAGMVDFFDVRGQGANPAGDRYSSARASGVPLLAGLILPEDVAGGSIAHALAFAIPNPRNLNPQNPIEGTDYFYPASRAEESYYNSDPNALAQGQRIRLKQTIVDEQGDTINENELAPITRMFLAALRTYGAYVVDNAGGLSFYAEDIHSAALNVSDDQINALIGKPAGTALATGKTRWQVVMDKLTEDNELGRIPIAYGPWTEGQAPSTATITTANFEVIAPATKP